MPEAAKQVNKPHCSEGAISDRAGASSPRCDGLGGEFLDDARGVRAMDSFKVKGRNQLEGSLLFHDVTGFIPGWREVPDDSRTRSTGPQA